MRVSPARLLLLSSPSHTGKPGEAGSEEEHGGWFGYRRGRELALHLFTFIISEIDNYLNMLEALKGDRQKKQSMRINNPYVR
jgi:hypothetical protein